MSYTKKVNAVIFMPKECYFKYETNKRNISVDVLKMLAKFYNVSMDYLCGLTENKSF